MDENAVRKLMFRSPSHSKAIGFDSVLRQIQSFLYEDTEACYEFTVGTDSAARDTITNFVTAIVMHRKGRGGRYFWVDHRNITINSFENRMFMEGMLSLQLAQVLFPEIHKLRFVLSPMPQHARNGSGIRMKEKRIECAVHVDLGPNGKSRKMLDSVTGMMVGAGLIYASKPHAYAASTVADLHV